LYLGAAICFLLPVTARFGVHFICTELISFADSCLLGLLHFGLLVRGLMCVLVLVDADVRFSFSFPALGQGKLPFLYSHCWFFSRTVELFVSGEIFVLLCVALNPGCLLFELFGSALLIWISRSGSLVLMIIRAPAGGFTQYSHSDPVSGFYLPAPEIFSSCCSFLRWPPASSFLHSSPSSLLAATVRNFCSSSVFKE
jgi:hypothetical protein